jgi:hypothetical protein
LGLNERKRLVRWTWILALTAIGLDLVDTVCQFSIGPPGRRIGFHGSIWEEIHIENGLPLGLAPDADYAETKLPLDPQDVLTLLSDGVVEARNEAGELFGFERAKGIAHEPAETIAQAAQSFGQDDDITVVALTMLPAAVLQS